MPLIAPFQKATMQARAQRLACSLRSIDGCLGSYSVLPGEAPRSLARIEAVSWDRPPAKEVLQATFTLIGDMGMTGTIVMLNQYQWRSLISTKLVEPFYASLLWGGSPMKVVEDAAFLASKHGGA
jgi:hypothetical protein